MSPIGRFTAVFCDDIRQEANGKHILIGVYGSDLVPGILPQTVPLSVWIRLDDPPKGDRKFAFTLKSDDGEVGVDGRFNLPAVPDDQGAVLAIGQLPVNLSRPGQISALLAFDGDEPVEVGNLKVRPAPQKT